jgi:hypothetical protein
MQSRKEKPKQGSIEADMQARFNQRLEGKQNRERAWRPVL